MSLPFQNLGIRYSLASLLKSGGVFEPTPVQKNTIPVVLDGRDVIVQAQTGTGKTLAFALPILEKIQPDNRNVQALIITPTRELAIQITKEINKLASAIGCNVLAAYGGQDVESQIRKLQGTAHIVVGTPGRLLDHLRRGTVEFWKLSMLVLDEADQMLHMGFLNEVEEILSQTSKHRQTMLFSATMPDSVKRLAVQYMRDPEDIRIQGERITLDNINQYVVETTDRAKLQTLVKMVETDRPYLAVVFCRTKIRAKKLAESLLSLGLEVDELHGDLTQAKREQVMKRFRSAKLQLLVATDVAARGLDVEGVTHVFNYDIPQDAETYIHRIGRTGRAGHKGTAITLASPRDRMTLQVIERGIDATLERRSMGTLDVIAEAKVSDERTSRSAGASSRGRKTNASNRGDYSGKPMRKAPGNAGRDHRRNEASRDDNTQETTRGVRGQAQEHGRGRSSKSNSSRNGAGSSRSGSSSSRNGAGSSRSGSSSSRNGASSSRGGSSPARNGASSSRGGSSPARNGAGSSRGGGRGRSGR
ncbi:DEAD/DEAH box helicase [Paenibacillus abyssi]|uniref:RNA helicase n=1 Tax=Paenibacillus abyssi TaxID=1340531 RepID=A0A917D5E5_9BACL|nr:DEAD/DEAH box helicase [Paenibacillus abyssi]GGG11575.1 RNA helicase [Paenibacillus abyssi]